MNKRDDGAKCQPAWRRCLLASTLLSAVWVAQADGASAADILPGRVPVQVGADSSVLCTFWTGLGAEEYFFLADPDGDPMPVSAWLRWGRSAGARRPVRDALRFRLDDVQARARLAQIACGRRVARIRSRKSLEGRDGSDLFHVDDRRTLERGVRKDLLHLWSPDSSTSRERILA